MKKLFLLLILSTFSACSSEDSNEEEEASCCKHPISEITQNIKDNYDRILSSPDLTETQREQIEKEYQVALDNPCDHFIKQLESAGATCNGPH